jgi:multisubunit Na+/H+ antiporter MnhB subunit
MTLLTRAIARLLLLPIFMTALAMLVKGYADTGDGFSAGVIAATGILLQYVVFGSREAEQRLPVRIGPSVAIAGLCIMLLVAFVPVLLGEPPLTHHPAPGATVRHVGSLELHTAVLYDVGVFLLTVGFTVTVIGRIAHLDDEAAP